MEGREGIPVGGEMTAALPTPPKPLKMENISAGGGVASAAASSASTTKKMGRPRKYTPVGTLVVPLNPISASTPLGVVSMKQERGDKARQAGFAIQPHQSLGEMMACSAGANFMPHFINVASGEDVTTKIISFSQQSPRVICILSANGAISNATLRQPDSSGGTLTYEGRFELLSLSGSFMPSENGGTRSRSGGMSVSLVRADGRIVGGGVAGLLVAAGPVQVVVGSFLPGYQIEQKTKKSKLDTSISSPSGAIPLFTGDAEALGDRNSHSLGMPKANITTLKIEDWGSPLMLGPRDRKPSAEINISLQ